MEWLAWLGVAEAEAPPPLTASSLSFSCVALHELSNSQETVWLVLVNEGGPGHSQSSTARLWQSPHTLNHRARDPRDFFKGHVDT